ncbi:MAG: hypothetical protein M1817_006889 [Caeruleum heppii]|nr:MAG: hypothetical protein M1817_006889 [Caeruleum heppii]
MPSTRRLKVLLVTVILCVITILWFTSKARNERSPDFYTRTVRKMEQKDREAVEMAQKMQDRMQHAKNEGKAGSNQKPLEVPVPLKGAATGEKGVAGRKKMAQKVDDVQGDTKKAETKEEHELEVELNSILKRSPIIIFSKTQCPHSARAKGILVDKYKIVPSPFVVELDEHPLGPSLQNALEKTTGRRTVPNVLINGKSIGGGDDVSKLDTDGKLAELVQTMGGKRILEVTRVDPPK